ncbi:MAG: flagellar basal body P-ring formation chaperone FlgA [Bdellovibrionales bacterium]|jgi:flagella basal body P-ring formation protein FlgA|nr:flagellar basal body P-ring formation chaperone FlgA [Bdellovibrionales bacterium]
MIKYIIFSSFLILSLASQACEIKTYDRLITNRDQINTKKNSLIKETSCPKKVLEKFISLVQEVSGTIDDNKINSILSEEGLTEYISIRPKKIEIIPLSFFLRKNIKIKNQDILFDNIQVLDRSFGFGLDHGEKYNIQCSNCELPGLKNISLIFKSTQPLWLTAQLKFKVSALVATTNISPSMRPLDKGQVELRDIFVSHPNNYFTDLKLIRFYRPSRPIVKSAPLNINDVTKVDLVRIGRPTSIILDGSGFFISSTGIPMNNGKLYQSIKIKNTKTNKVVTAEVVDFNKVKIKL